MQFILQRVQYFLEVRKINQRTSLEEVCELLNVLDFWINEDYLEEDLITLRVKLLEEYLLGIHKNILVNDLKKSIEESSFRRNPIAPLLKASLKKSSSLCIVNIMVLGDSFFCFKNFKENFGFSMIKVLQYCYFYFRFFK